MEEEFIQEVKGGHVKLVFIHNIENHWLFLLEKHKEEWCDWNGFT